MDFSLQLTTLALLFPVIFLFITWLQAEKNTKKPGEAPEPAGALPILGHLHLIIKGAEELHQTLGSMADQCGPGFNIHIGSNRSFVISTMELAKECFTTNDRAISSRPFIAATRHMCYNGAVFGFAPYGSHWRELRKILKLEMLANQRLGMIKNVQASKIELGVRKLYDTWTNNKGVPVVVELNKWVEDLAFNVIVQMVAGKCDDRESERCKRAMQKFFYLLGIFVVSDALPFLWWLDLKGREKEMKKTAKELDGMLSGWLDEHRRKRDLGEIKPGGQPDFIDLMLSLEEKGDLSGFTFDEDTIIKSTSLAIIIGAGDTKTLTWAISLLLDNPSTLRRAQQEIDLHVGKDRRVEESDIKNLVYIQAIIKETVRLYPITPIIAREVMEDCTIGGFRVPANTNLLVNVWKIQRDPRVWQNPSDFKPERFFTSNVGVDVRGHHFELIPFGAGRRSCPGASFGLHALHLTLARLLQGFDLVNSKDGPAATPLGGVLVSPRLEGHLYT